MFHSSLHQKQITVIIPVYDDQIDGSRMQITQQITIFYLFHLRSHASSSLEWRWCWWKLLENCLFDFEKWIVFYLKYLHCLRFILVVKLYCTIVHLQSFVFFLGFFLFCFIHFIDLWKKKCLKEKRQKSNINKWGNMQRIISEYDTDEKRFIQKVKTPS